MIRVIQFPTLQIIMVFFKQLIISTILGFVAYEVTKVTLHGGFQLPVTTPEISLLMIFIGTALIASLIAGRGASHVSDDEREFGTVKWFNVRKGYGFITRDQGDDIFVHFRNIEGDDRRAISEGQRVSFIVTDSEKGLQADKVMPA